MPTNPLSDLELLAAATLTIQQNLVKLQTDLAELTNQVSIISSRQTEQLKNRAFNMGVDEALVAMFVIDWALRPVDQKQELHHYMEEWAKQGHGLALQGETPVYQVTDGVQSVLSRLRKALGTLE